MPTEGHFAKSLLRPFFLLNLFELSTGLPIGHAHYYYLQHEFPKTP